MCLLRETAARRRIREVPYWLRLRVGSVQQIGGEKEEEALVYAMRIAELYLEIDDVGSKVVVVVVGGWEKLGWSWLT